MPPTGQTTETSTKWPIIVQTPPPAKAHARTFAGNSFRESDQAREMIPGGACCVPGEVITREPSPTETIWCDTTCEPPGLRCRVPKVAGGQHAFFLPLFLSYPSSPRWYPLFNAAAVVPVPRILALIGGARSTCHSGGGNVNVRGRSNSTWKPPGQKEDRN